VELLSNCNGTLKDAALAQASSVPECVNHARRTVAGFLSDAQENGHPALVLVTTSSASQGKHLTPVAEDFLTESHGTNRHRFPVQLLSGAHKRGRSIPLADR